MKYTLKRSTSFILDYESKFNIKKVILEGEALVEFLYKVLVDVMSESLDPDLAGRTPEIYLKRLQEGALGDFTKRYIIAAENDEKTIGILIGLPDSREEGGFHIFSLGTSPSYRDKGICTSLISRCIEELRSSGYTSLILDVHEDNTPAFHLYKKLGFS